MKRYSPELKEQMVRKMMPPSNQSVAEISRETGISDVSLYAWKKQFQAQGHVVPKSPNNPDRWDAKAKLGAASIDICGFDKFCQSTPYYCSEVNSYGYDECIATPTNETMG